MPKISLDTLLLILSYGGSLSALDSWGLSFDFVSCRMAEEAFYKLGHQPGYDTCRHHSQIDFYISGVVRCEGGSHI